MSKHNDSDAVDEIIDDLIAELFVYKEQVNTGVINASQAVEFESEVIKVAKTQLDQHYTAIREEAVIEAKMELLKDFQPGKDTDPEHLATLMQEEIMRLSYQLKASKEK